jgi:ATP-binding cassette subfamily B protein
MEVFRIRRFSINDQRVIRNRISHFEELQKAVDVILLKLQGWLKAQIKEKKEDFNNKIIRAERKKAISYSVMSLWYLLFLFAAIALMTKEALAGGIAVGGLLLAFSTLMAISKVFPLPKKHRGTPPAGSSCSIYNRA